MIRQFCLIPLGERKNFVEQVREFTNIGKLLEKACKGMGLHFLTQSLPGEKKERFVPEYSVIPSPTKNSEFVAKFSN